MNLEKKEKWKDARSTYSMSKTFEQNSSSRISKSKSPIRRIVRVKETSNSPLQARGEHRKRVIIKGRDGTKIQWNITFQTVNSNITRRYLLMLI